MGNKVSGIHAIEETLKNRHGGFTLYLIKGDKRNSYLEKLALSEQRAVVKRVSEAELDKIAGNNNHRGAVLDLGKDFSNRASALIKETSVQSFCKLLEESCSEKNSKILVLALDGITDPHNLGAILRSADQFSVSLVLVPQHRSAQANETVIRVSSGAAQYVRLSVVKNLVAELDYLKKNGFWVYGADMDKNASSSSYNTDFAQRSVIVLGSEGSGIRPLVKTKCDYVVSIPMSGHIDSLNVSVAAGILMYEFNRQLYKFHNN